MLTKDSDKTISWKRVLLILIGISSEVLCVNDDYKGRFIKLVKSAHLWLWLDYVLLVVMALISRSFLESMVWIK